MSLTIRRLTLHDNRLSFELENAPIKTLWFEVDHTYAGWFRDDRYDAAVIAILPHAMHRGETIRVEGGVTGALVHNLRNGVAPILAEQLPTLRGTSIEAVGLDLPGPRGSAVMTGLSSGIDSFSTIAVHKSHPVRDLKISHFSFHDVGSHGRADPDGIFKIRLLRARNLATRLELPLIEVRTNMSALQVSDFQQHHTLWNSSVAIALGRGVGTYLYSSTVPYRDISVRKVKDIAYADPILLPLLSSSGVQCVSTNAELTRLAKTALIADDPLVQEYLDVCVRPRSDGSNCSKCWKCCRELLTLELLGKLDRFRRAFDMEEYRKVRDAHIVYMLANGNDPHLGNLLDLARAQKTPLDTIGRVACANLRRLAETWATYLPDSLAWRLNRRLTQF